MNDTLIAVIGQERGEKWTKSWCYVPNARTKRWYRTYIAELPTEMTGLTR